MNGKRLFRLAEEDGIKKGDEITIVTTQVLEVLEVRAGSGFGDQDDAGILIECKGPSGRVSLCQKVVEARADRSYFLNGRG